MLWGRMCQRDWKMEGQVSFDVPSRLSPLSDSSLLPPSVSDQFTTALPNTVVKLPWELTSIYSDFLDERQASTSSFQPSSLGGFDLGLDDFSSTSTTAYEDQLHQIYRDNLQRLKVRVSSPSLLRLARSRSSRRVSSPPSLLSLLSLFSFLLDR